MEGALFYNGFTLSGKLWCFGIHGQNINIRFKYLEMTVSHDVIKSRVFLNHLCGTKYIVDMLNNKLTKMTPNESNTKALASP